MDNQFKSSLESKTYSRKINWQLTDYIKEVQWHRFTFKHIERIIINSKLNEKLLWEANSVKLFRSLLIIIS